MPTCHALPLIAHAVDISPAGKPNAIGGLGVSARVMIGSGHERRAASKIAKRHDRLCCPNAARKTVGGMRFCKNKNNRRHDKMVAA